MPKKSSPKPPKEKTHQVIINLLKQEGAMDSQQLANRLGLSTMAIRQHLYDLQNKQLVSYHEEPRTIGRPAKLWCLTLAADQFFPNGYADLTISLITAIISAFGESGLEKLLEIRTQQQLIAYQAEIPKQSSIAAKLAVLVEVRTREGYMAEAKILEDSSWLLIENHCPICAAATLCTGLCAKELEVFQAVLGEEVEISRTEHIPAGARRCAYRVTTRNLSQDASND